MGYIDVDDGCWRRKFGDGFHWRPLVDPSKNHHNDLSSYVKIYLFISILHIFGEVTKCRCEVAHQQFETVIYLFIRIYKHKIGWNMIHFEFSVKPSDFGFINYVIAR